MKSKYALFVGVIVGTGIWYFFGVYTRRGVFLGGIIAIAWTVVTYGHLAFPAYSKMRSGPHSNLWHLFIAIFGIIATILSTITPEVANNLSMNFLLGGLWLGGTYAGIILVETADDVSES